MTKAQRKERDLYLKAAEMLAQGIENHSCVAIHVVGSRELRDKYINTFGWIHDGRTERPSLWIIDVELAALDRSSHIDYNWHWHRTDTELQIIRDFRVMLVSLMAWASADLPEAK
jgi:hypothetical protein